MITLRRLQTWVFLSVAGVGLSSLPGCGDDTGLDKRYPVSGTVKYKGQPVEKGQINFVAVDKVKQRDAGGLIQGGSYSLTTSMPGDGALPGEYNVTIISKDIDDSKVIETINKQGGGGRQADVAKAAVKAKNLVPGKYQLVDTSGLKGTVKAEPNTIDFDLTD